MTWLFCVSGNLKKIILFCVVGLIGLIVNYGIFSLLISVGFRTGIYYTISSIISIEAMLLTNFFLNRAWTFEEEARYVSFESAIIKDHAIRFFGILLLYACLYSLWALHIYRISLLIGIFIAVLWNYIGNVMWEWKIDD